MKNLTDARWIKLKGLLFLVLGLLSSALLLALHFDCITALLFAISIWSFCRFYYFAFYVIEKYVDGSYRFSGLGSFMRYVVTGQVEKGESNPQEKQDSVRDHQPPQS